MSPHFSSQVVVVVVVVVPYSQSEWNAAECLESEWQINARPNPPSSFIDDEENGNSVVVRWSHAEIDKRLGNKAAKVFFIHSIPSVLLSFDSLAQWYAVRRRGLADRFEFIVLQEDIHRRHPGHDISPRPRLITDKLSFLSTSAAGETLFCSKYKRKPLLPKCLSKRFANQQKILVQSSHSAIKL